MAPDDTAHRDRIAVSHVRKTFGRVVALDDVSFEIAPGEILGLIGPNGAGKTTLFECLAGLLPVDRGEIVSGGKPLTGTDRASRLFYVPDAIAPWPSQPLGWALDFVCGFFGGSLPRRAELVKQLNLVDLQRTPIGALSKGQRKRAVLAMGLLTPQPLLLIDEPFDGLDLKQNRELNDTLRSAAADGRTLFLSIHQIADAARICDRFVLLSSGRVRGEGTIDDLSSLAAARSAMGTLPGQNLEEIFLALT